MSSVTSIAQPVSLGRRIKRFMSDQPLVPLIILLIALVIVLQIVNMRTEILKRRVDSLSRQAAARGAA